MKKCITVGIATIILSTLLAGCQKNPSVETPEPEQPAAFVNLGADANCFITPLSDSCRFATTRAKGSVASARLIWESTPGMISGLQYQDDGVGFRATANGNALVAACDETGSILWSWHIWCPEVAVETVLTKSGYQLMCLNLGAMDNKEGSASSYGLLYQWGRKDPFPASPTATGDTKTVGVVYGPDGKQLAMGVGSYAEKDGTIEASIANPTTVYSNYATYGKNMDWLAVSDNTLWGDEKTLYDPCPAGYKVPGTDVFLSFTTTGGYTTNPADFDIAEGSGWNGGWTFNMADGSLYFPAAARYDGTYAMLYGSVSGLWGAYWGAATGSQDDYGACILAFQQGSVSAVASASKADAYSIRCVKETVLPE